jgi:lipopolysaccharide transport protein LptA
MGRIRKLRLLRGVGVLLALLGMTWVAPPASTEQKKEDKNAERQLPISYDFDSGDVDYKNKTADFKTIVVVQGSTRITADRAHAVGLDEQGFQDGRWTFTGNVHIDAEPQGQLRSNEAVVEFRDKQIAKATATGKPAEFQQRRPDTGLLTRGHANLIVYDVGAGTIRLTNDAWLDDGQRQVTGPLITYSMREQRVQADSVRGDKQRVHITIIPQHNAASVKSESAKSDSSSAASSKPEPRQP